MSRKPIAPTPEKIVQDAVANSRLSGYEVREDVRAVMLRIARGEMSVDQLGLGRNSREPNGRLKETADDPPNHG